MTTGTLLVAGIIALLAVVAICVLVRDRANGRSSCGCNCKSCSKCSCSNVTIDEGDGSRDGNRRGSPPPNLFPTLFQIHFISIRRYGIMASSMNGAQFLMLCATILALGVIGTLVLNSDPDYFIRFELDVSGDEGREIIDGTGHNCTDDFVVLYANVRDGYVFEGWYDEDGGILCRDEEFDFFAENIKYYAKTTRGAYVEIIHMDGLITSDSQTYRLGETATAVALTCGNDMPSFKGWYDPDGKLLSKNPSYEFVAKEDVRLVAMSDSRFFYGDERLDWKVSFASTARNVSVSLYDGYSGDLIENLGDSLKGTSYLIPGKYVVKATGTLSDGTTVTETSEYDIAGDIKRMYYWLSDKETYHIEWTALEDDYLRFTNSKAERSPYTESEEEEFIDISSRSILSLADALSKVTEGMTSLEKADCVLKFVQRCTEYGYDDLITDDGEYWKYPLETIVQRQGDCEDTSLLYACLMAAMGYDTIVLIYDGYEYAGIGHAAAGVALNYVPDGSYYKINGKKYYYCETTSDVMDVGEDIEEYESARYMFIV